MRLAGRELLRLPETLPREARALDASRNRLPALPRSLPGWAALRSLNLGGNRLTHLPVRPARAARISKQRRAPKRRARRLTLPRAPPRRLPSANWRSWRT